MMNACLTSSQTSFHVLTPHPAIHFSVFEDFLTRGIHDDDDDIINGVPHQNVVYWQNTMIYLIQGVLFSLS